MKMPTNECCGGRACRQWVKKAGYDFDEPRPDHVCEECGFGGPYYFYNQAQEYGWGWTPEIQKMVAALYSKHEAEIKRLFQFIVRSVESKVDFQAMVSSFEKGVGGHEKAVEVSRAVLTIVTSAITETDDEKAMEIYKEQVPQVPFSKDAIAELRSRIADEISIWFRARGRLLIGESIESVEAFLKGELGEG